MVSGLFSAKTVVHLSTAPATASFEHAVAVCTETPTLNTSTTALIARRVCIISSLISWATSPISARFLFFRPHFHRVTKQRDELAPFQLIELHSVPCQPGPDCRISNLQAISQRACWNFATSLGSAYAGGRPPATHSAR